MFSARLPPLRPEHRGIRQPTSKRFARFPLPGTQPRRRPLPHDWGRELEI